MKNIFTSLRLLGACTITLPASPAHSEGKAKDKQKVESEEKGKRARQAGGLPYGLEQYTEKKGELPSGLQKKKDEHGQLIHGLEQGDKKSKSSSKAKNDSK
jgi:hypothetical protein